MADSERIIIPDDRVEVLDRDDTPVITHPTPFTSEIKLIYAKPGANLADIVATVPMHPQYRDIVGVWINDRFIERSQWATTVPAKGEMVYLRIIPTGGNSGKDVLRMIAMIAITAVAFATGQWAAGAMMLEGFAFNVVAFAVTAGVTMLGYAALNAIIPPPGLDKNDQDQRYQLTGTQNRFAPYANIPRVFGKRRMFPLHAARPYSEIQGDDEYLRICLVVGWGPLEITNIKIGDTPITAFDGVQVEVREGWATDTPLTLFTKTVTQEDISVQLEPPLTTGYYPANGTPLFSGNRYNFVTATETYGEVTSPTATNDWYVRTTSTNCVEFSIDLAYPQGVFRLDNDGRRQETTVVCECQYRVAGSGGAWTNAAWANSADTGFNVAGVITTKGKDTSAIRRSGRVVLPAVGQYEVRVRRSTANAGDKHVDMVWWTTLRSIKSDYPVLQSGLALIAIRMKASNQLNGTPSSINCEAESYLPVWNGSTWTYTKTSNPAWAYADLLRRRNNATYLPDSRIDITGLAAWATACATTAPNASEPYWSFNGVIEGGSIFDNLKRVAAVGRANYTMKDGKHSVVRDVSQTVPVQHITPRNSWGYSGSKAFIEYPHALRVTFSNAAKGYQKDEVIVYWTGYNSGNATKFEVLDMGDCVSATQAWREGMYQMASMRLRPEEHSVTMDIEHLKATVGDLVQFSHDVVAIGVQATRVETRNTAASNTTGFVMEDALYFEVGSTYAVRIRKSDGTSVVYPVNNPGTGYTNTVVLTTPVATSGAANVGDLVMFGKTNLETAPMLIKRIEPGADLTARISLVDAQPGVWTADTGVIPAFNSYITLPSIAGGGSPPSVYIQSVRSDDSVMIINEDGGIVYRIGVSLQQPVGSVERIAYYEIQWKEKESAGGWQTMRVEKANPFAYIFPVQVGDVYQLMSRGVSEDGGFGDWSTMIEHTVLGKNLAPDPPTSITATAIAGGIRLNWTNPLDNDLWQIEVYENTTNTSAGATLIGVTADNLFTRTGLTPANGARFYFLKAVDTSGNASAFTASVTATALSVGLSIGLSNDSIALAASSAGVVSSFANAVGQMTVFDGSVDVTASATLSVAASVNATGTVNTAANTPVNGQPKGYYQVTALSADNGKITLQAVYNGQTISKDFTLSKAIAGATGAPGSPGSPGAAGNSSALVFLYQRAASAPAVPSVTSTYTFATGVLSGHNNGWSQTVPAGSNPLYVTTAPAVGTGATDTIGAGEWATPTIMAQDGAAGAPGSPGTAGQNSAIVFLFQRTTTSTPPSVPSVTTTFTFSTGALSGVNNGWSQTMPTTGGAYRWMITAAALGPAGAATDTIGSGEWSSPAIVGQDGANGTNGSNGANGAPAVWLDVSNLATQLFAYADGTVPSFAAAVGQLKVFEGGVDVTASATLSAVATGCTGSINTALNTPVTGAKGSYRVTAMSADTATLVMQAVYNSITYTVTFALAKIKTGYEIVGSLPGSNLFDGRIVFLTTDKKLYTYKAGTGWVNAVNTTDLAGTIGTSQIADSAITNIKIGDGQITNSKIVANSIASDRLMSGGRANLLYGSDGWGADITSWFKLGWNPDSKPFTGPSYSVAGDQWNYLGEPRGTLGIRQNDGTAGGVGLADFYFVRRNTTGGENQWYNARPGLAYTFAITHAAHRCRHNLFMGFYDASFNYITEVGLPGGMITPGAGHADNVEGSGWTRSFVSAVAPANTRYILLALRREHTTQGFGYTDSYSWVTRAGLWETDAVMTVAPAWAPPGLTLIQGGNIVTDSITADQIAALTITGNEIAGLTITGAKIAALTITANELQAGAVTAAKISVTSLSAISANLGAITAGSIDIGSGKFQVASDGTVTIRNASSGQRLVITNSVLEVYDASNVRRVRLGIW